MSVPTKVSVAIVTFNGRDDLEDCLRSVFALEGGHVDDVIVVDNASTDGTAEMVAAKFPSVNYKRLATNDGPCPARNAGLEAAKHRLVFQLDQDLVVRKNCLAKLVAAMTPEHAVVFPRALDAAHPDVVHYDGGSFHYAGVMALRHFFRPVAECDPVARDVDAFISLAALVDKEKLLAVGGYDPAFFILFEDHDLSYRLRLAGHRIRALPDAIVEHRAGTAGISFRGGDRYPARRLFLHSRNRWMVVMKCYRWRTIVLAMPGVLFLGVVYLLFATIQGAAGDYVRAKRSLIAHWPHIREERKKIARFRKVRDRELLGAPELTFSPRIEGGRGKNAAGKVISGALKVWWWIVKWIAG